MNSIVYIAYLKGLMIMLRHAIAAGCLELFKLQASCMTEIF